MEWNKFKIWSRTRHVRNWIKFSKARKRRTRRSQNWTMKFPPLAKLYSRNGSQESRLVVAVGIKKNPPPDRGSKKQGAARMGARKKLETYRIIQYFSPIWQDLSNPTQWLNGIVHWRLWPEYWVAWDTNPQRWLDGWSPEVVSPKPACSHWTTRSTPHTHFSAKITQHRSDERKMRL